MLTDSSADAARSEAERFVREENPEYLVTNDGITVFLPEYALGYSYAEGCKEILVWTFVDSSLVGYDVWPAYNLLSQDA